MKGKRFKEEQIIRILHEAERGLTVAEVCRQHNCSEQSFYRWKAKFGGMEVSDVKRLRELHRENAGLKKIVAEQNAYIERYNRTVRYNWLAQFLFDSIEEVQEYATRWLWTYNHERPNMGLGGITPIQKLAMVA